jgi:hypothetical protein
MSAAPHKSAAKNPFRKSARKPFAACQAQVLAFTKLGCSRRLAAEKAGCCHTTIGRAARRDPAFAAQLEEAENHVDVAALTRIQEASSENKNWRAAAWILERRHPEEFGRRAPHSFSADQVMGLLAEVFSFTMPVLPQDKANDFLRAFNRAMGRVEGNAKNADRWQKLAGVNVARGPNGEPLRSPYEHPQWRDPDRPRTAKEESDEAITWINGLPKDDFNHVRDIYYREKAAEKERASETVKERLLRLLAEEKEAEAAAKKQADEPAATVEPPVAVADVPQPAVEKLPPVAAEPKCQEPAVQEATPSTASCSPQPPHVEREACVPPSVPRPACEDYVPPTATENQTEHRAYQEWLLRSHQALQRNLLIRQTLRQQAPAAPPDANLAGGAYEARLQEWCEAMRR